MVTAVDLPGKEITLILDPTNPGIGIVDNGCIYMFSAINGKGIEPRVLANFMMLGLDETIEYINASTKSIFQNNRIDELKRIYGPEALNKDLEYIKGLEGNKKQNIVSKINVDEEKAVENAKTKSQNIREEQDEKI